jgi:hypothetical protein
MVKCQGTLGQPNPDDPDAGVVGATFSVSSRVTTFVNVQMICLDPTNLNQGAVLFHGYPSCCPTWDTLIANPDHAETLPPGNTTLLTANASGPCAADDGGPGVHCVWTVAAGNGTVGATDADGNGNFVATFTCPMTQETDTLMLVCEDGPLPDGGFCPASLTTGSTTVPCVIPPPCTLPGETGVVANPDSAAGTCSGVDSKGNPLVNAGTADARGDFCCVPPP